MSWRSSLRQLWAELTKPREAAIPRIMRRRSVRRRIRQGPELLLDERDYDRAVRDYLVIWLWPRPGVSHHEAARLYFGLDEDLTHYVDQVLYSAAFETLPNWMNCHEDPWFQAAWRHSQALDRALLDRLRWAVENQD